MKNIVKIFINLVFVALSFAVVAQDNVSNIRVQQMDHVLIILYDLAKQADIEVFASFDGGATFSEALRHVTGAVGSGVNPGTDKMVAWNVLEEFGEIDYPNTVIKIVSTNVEESDRIVHTIRSGETLGSIAKRYGVSVRDLQKWNNMRGTRIVAGRQLIVLNPKFESATIKIRNHQFDPIYDTVPVERRRRRSRE